MIYPSTATLTGDGISTAVITPPSGFGEGFGEAFGGWVTVVTATLADNGVSTAVAEEVLVSAELQLV